MFTQNQGPALVGQRRGNGHTVTLIHKLPGHPVRHVRYGMHRKTADCQLGVEVDILSRTSIHTIAAVCRLPPGIVMVGVEGAVQALKIEIAGNRSAVPGNLVSRIIKVHHARRHRLTVATQKDELRSPLVVGITNECTDLLRRIDALIDEQNGLQRHDNGREALSLANRHDVRKRICLCRIEQREKGPVRHVGHLRPVQKLKPVGDAIVIDIVCGTTKLNGVAHARVLRKLIQLVANDLPLTKRIRDGLVPVNDGSIR